MKRAYADIPLGQMHYRYCGKGEPLILVHFAGSCSDEYEEVGEFLADRFSVYAIDLFGMGFSTKPDHQLSIAEHAQTVIDFMDAMKIDKTYLYGAMVGANVCVKVAIQCPERVKKAIFTQVIYMKNFENFLARRSSSYFDPLVLKEDGSHLLEVWKKGNLEAGYSPEINTWRTTCLLNCGDFIENMHHAVFSEDYNIYLPQVKVPCVLVKLEKSVNAPHMDDAIKLLPHAEFDVYEGGNYFHAKVYPRKVADMIIKHLP